ncbi:MAG: Wzz/FepE/Etk N-terminal domain-containing protein, partial [Candidatus Omnitrophota bacterium]|nr:Wzz/FepE/Etk N-terminal domain-containing protein [Candidatus Omnitrophota bacterium]
MAQQPQYDLNIRDYWRVLKKRRVIILLTFISVVIATAVYNNLQTPVYQATVTVRIQYQSTVISALTEKFLGYNKDVLSAEEKIVNSYPVIEAAVKKLNLIKESTTNQEKDDIINEISKTLTTEKLEEAQMIKISYESNDSKKAKDVANAIAET